MGMDLLSSLHEIRENPRPGMVDAIARATIDGETPDDLELLGILSLLIGGGFDTTTALTSHALEWLSQNPDQREILSAERDTLLDSATEEFLRFFCPSAGDGRTFSADVELDGVQFQEGERVWLSWAMANRDPELFTDPDEIDLERKGNRHFSFGLGAHRCIGSSLARTMFKRMLAAVLDRMPDFHCDPEGRSTTTPSGSSKACVGFRPPSRRGPDSATASTRRSSGSRRRSTNSKSLRR